MLNFYRFITKIAEPAFDNLLKSRCERGKEVEERLQERKGITDKKRPAGRLIWLHAASVGEAQSALILIEKLLQNDPSAHVLVTTGTVTSAAVMEQKLPERAFHQFYPLDHPEWVTRFLDHWQPDLVLWIESELWPNMLSAVRKRNIPAALVNARLSETSFRRWRMAKKSIRKLLKAFHLILAQTEQDARHFTALGGQNISVTDNLKYSAAPLPCDDGALQNLSARLQGRPLWLFASTHKGEEALASRVHQQLKAGLPDILTVIVPRHPERGQDIKALCEESGLSSVLRSKNSDLRFRDEIYIADTLGELGLFYRLAPIACIGRSFSDDGGGGHNPIEAAQLHCAVLYGPNVQYQKQIYDEMNAEGAALQIRNDAELTAAVLSLLNDPEKLATEQNKSFAFAAEKEKVIDTVMETLSPLLETMPPGTGQKKRA